jgi:CubicO group peptidase (beta-lactamase class C family)
MGVGLHSDVFSNLATKRSGHYPENARVRRHHGSLRRIYLQKLQLVLYSGPRSDRLYRVPLYGVKQVKRPHSSLLARIVPHALVALLQAGICLAGPIEHRPILSAWPHPLPAAGPTTSAEMESFIDGFMSVQIPSSEAAGVTVAVVKDGQLFFAKGYGYADPDERIPVDPDKSLFRPGSVSKTFTWTAVMQLVEAGKLDLDTDVNTYLRDFKLPATYPAPVTLRNLMTHTPGFEDGAVGYLFKESPADLVPLGQFLRQHMPARARPPTTDFSSGSNASYSNWGTALAGHIVEIISGQPFDDYIEQHIFTPLGMTRSTFREPIPQNLAGDFHGGFEREDGKFELKGFEYIHSAGPAGSLSSTATDMAKFMIAHLQGGANEHGRILKPETEQLMQTRTMSPDPALNGSLLGFYETWINGQRIVGHGGDTTHFHTELALLPEQHLGLFVSVNTGGEAATTAVRLQRAFFEHYFPAELPKVTPPADAQARNARYAGLYRVLRHSYTKFEKVFSITADTKVAAMPDGTLLIPDSFDEKQARWAEVGDGVFRRLDIDKFVAFKDIRNGQAQALVGDFSPIASERIAWYESGTLHEVLLGFCTLTFVLAIVAAWRQRKIDCADQTGMRWARPTLALAAVLLLAFLCGLLLTMAGGIESLIYSIPTGLYVSLTFPLLALPAVIASIYFAVKAWTSGAWRVRQRLYYTVATLAGVTFLAILNYWNLVGYRFG